MSSRTTTQEFFEDLYQQNTDPWRFASSQYELGRYSAILQAINHTDPDRRFHRTFEPGCSIGILTAELASISREVFAIDISPTAVRRAREHCRGLMNVDIQCGALPAAMPAGQFDLILFSEIGYYFTEKKLLTVADTLTERLGPRGMFLAAHWLGQSPDHLLSGDRVHQILLSVGGLIHDHAEHHDGFRLDRWIRG